MGRLTVGAADPEGSPHHQADQPAPEHINARLLAAWAAGEPVISVDTKKK
jgi:hypothetical protein